MLSKTIFILLTSRNIDPDVAVKKKECFGVSFTEVTLTNAVSTNVSIGILTLSDLQPVT